MPQALQNRRHDNNRSSLGTRVMIGEKDAIVVWTRKEIARPLPGSNEMRCVPKGKPYVPGPFYHRSRLQLPYVPRESIEKKDVLQ